MFFFVDLFGLVLKLYFIDMLLSGCWVILWKVLGILMLIILSIVEMMLIEW